MMNTPQSPIRTSPITQVPISPNQPKIISSVSDPSEVMKATTSPTSINTKVSMSQVPQTTTSLKQTPVIIAKKSLKRVRDINWSDRKYIRAGIIPMIEQGGVRFFGFGIENVVGAIGDFGGHRERKDKDALDSALREYKEEALNVFGELTREIVQDYYVLEGTDTAEILVPISGPMYQYTEMFRNMVGTNIEYEVQDIIWLSRRQLLTAIDSQETSFNGTKIYHMYNRIRDTIHMNRDII